MSLLASELTIGSMIVKNRIVMPPMASNRATEEGGVVPEIIEHYETRSRESVGTIIVEHTYVSPGAKSSIQQMGIYEDELILGLSAIAASISSHGCLASIQLTHPGSNTKEGVCEGTPVAPSAVTHPMSGMEPRELSREEMSELKAHFVHAALRAEKAGFQAVELHGAHGYLLNQFLSPLTNKRTDAYGGSLENRAKFPLEVVEAVRTALQLESILMYRLGADDLLEGGLTIDVTAQAAAWLEDAGVDFFDVSGGISGPEIASEKPGYFRVHSRAVKETVEVPVMVTGGITTSEQAEEILESGDADAIGVGRALLENPKWASAALEFLG